MTCQSTPTPELADLKRRLNVTTTTNDQQLEWCLRVATAWTDERVYEQPDQQPGERHPEVVEAILIGASRLYARRNSPAGVEGWNELGVVRVLSDDPDIARLLAFHLDYSRIAGVA